MEKKSTMQTFAKIVKRFRNEKSGSESDEIDETESIPSLDDEDERIRDFQDQCLCIAYMNRMLKIAFSCYQ